MTDVIGTEQVAKATALLQRYKTGKAALDKRIVDNELWFRMQHWANYKNEMMEGKPKPSSGSYYKAKFARAAADIADAGHTPINPALQPEGMSNADYMRISFAQLDSADAVAFLPDWEDSTGARLEHLWVEYTGKPTYDIKSARHYRWTLATTREGEIRGVVDGRWDFNGMTRDEVMDTMRLCTGASLENCDKCPLHAVDHCDDVLMQAAFELLQHHQFLIDEQEGGHGK